jgi:hypothetical protein
MTRPSESLTAAVGTILGALFILLGATEGGFDFDELKSPEVQGAVMLLVSWIAAGVTWYIAKRQRAGELTSAKDGSVEG